MIRISPIDAKQEQFDPIEIFGKPALFTSSRIDRKTIPPGLYAYDLRHGDSGNPATIEKFVRVNHCGTVILNRPIAMTQGDYRRLSSRNICFTGEGEQTLRQYMNKHPPHKKERER